MKTISKLIILGISFLLLSFTMIDVSYGASAVKGLDLHKIKDRPGNDPYFNSSSKKLTFDRFLELLLMGKKPDEDPVEKRLSESLDTSAKKSWADCLLAARHLSSNARDEVLTTKGSRPLCSTGVGNTRKSFVWVGNNQFEREDSHTLFKKKYLQQIKDAAAKVASFEGFKEIVTVHRVMFNPERYNRESEGFAISIRPGLNNRIVYMNDTKLIYLWKVNEAKARELVSGPLSKIQTFYAEEVIELGDAIKYNQYSYYSISGLTKSIVLYEDKARTKVLHRFAREDFINTESIAAREAIAKEKARFDSLERLPIVSSKYFMSAYAKMSGKGLKLADEIVDGREYRGGNSFEKEKAREDERALIKKFMTEELSRFDTNKPVWISGHIAFGEYNIKESHFPAKVTISVADTSDAFSKRYANVVHVQIVKSQVEKIPVPPEIANSIHKTNVIYFRALVKPFRAISTNMPQHFVGGTLDMILERMELIVVDTRRGVPALHLDIVGENKVLWTYTPPAYKEKIINTVKERGKIDEKIKACAASSKGPMACYPQLCREIRALGDEEGYTSCNADYINAYKKWKNSLISAINNKEADRVKTQMHNQGTERICRNRYSGSSVQSWMPVKGTPEYKTAMTACLSEPERDLYGPDILGLRLGMPLTDAKNFIKRQSIKFNANSTDSRPFEKATLYWTGDSNHGIAVFSLASGGHERVAAVSRRLYMGEKKLTTNQVLGGLRKKYGQELWSNGGRTLLWASPKGSNSPSANKCSELAELVEPRGGWDKPWGDGNSRGRARNRRQAAAMSAVAPQQECMAKHGMPTGPEDMMKLAQCIQELSLNATAPSGSARSSTESESGARLPFMVTATGTSKLFAGYESCGVVTIAHISTDNSGTVTDVSSVLFDPSWIARQPDFSFKSGKEEDLIDF